MLIVQGNQDEYGGPEVVKEYPLSPVIEFLFVESTHGYKMNGSQWSAILSRIESTLSPR